MNLLENLDANRGDVRELRQEMRGDCRHLRPVNLPELLQAIGGRSVHAFSGTDSHGDWSRAFGIE